MSTVGTYAPRACGSLCQRVQADLEQIDPLTQAEFRRHGRVDLPDDPGRLPAAQADRRRAAGVELGQPGRRDPAVPGRWRR